MPPHLPVPKLRTLAAQIVVNDLVDFVTVDGDCNDRGNVDKEKDMQMKQMMLSSIPANICEDILMNILGCDCLNVLERLHALELLLCRSFRCLVLGGFPALYHPQVLAIIAIQGAGLTTLDLRGTWVKKVDEQSLCEVFKHLLQLMVLRIPHIATDLVLETIGRHNRCLRMLDISGESCITRRGIDALCSNINSRLELVSVGRPGDVTFLEPASVSLLIRHLPRLTSLGCYAYVGQALGCVPEDVLLETGLVYVHDTGTDVGRMQMIIRRCPHIESVFLDRPEDDVVSRLGSMAKLRDVKLSRFQCVDVKRLVEKCGRNLVTLNLVIGYGILDVSRIAERCVALSTLKCYKLEHLVYFEETHFLCLRTLEIFYSTLSTTCLRYLISCSPRLENICLYDNFTNLSNNVISQVFSKGTYENIRVLRISNASLLSGEVIGTIFNKCPNLKVLGYLGTWGISPEETEELQLYIKFSNFDLKLEL